MENGIIRNKQNKLNYPEHFTDNDMTLTNMNDVVDRFNNFFVNVGPKLGKDIKSMWKKCSEMDHLERNPNSIFLGTVENKEL